VPIDRVLSQEEIDSVFRNLRDGVMDEDPARRAQPYDFRRPDRIAKDQLRAIHLLHENFARSLASSLSAYLRAYAMVNLVSVEQLSFMEFTQCLPSPSCMISLSMHPYDGNAVLEINPSLVFPIIEMLLGGAGKVAAKINREVTEIEQSILEGLYRIILNDLRMAWQQVCSLEFKIEGFETEPQLLQILAPNEAVVAISMEVRIGDNGGMMNLGIPSIIMKMMRQRFDQQWSVRRTQSSQEEHSRILRLVKPSDVRMEARLRGPRLSLQDLLRIEPGQVLTFDHNLEKPMDFLINGKLKFHGHIVNAGRKRAFHVQEFHNPAE
jgi:flagellar motor switch protein FliM